MSKPIKVSDESVNSYNIRILTAGGDFSRFLKNPIMLLNHIRMAHDGRKDGILPLGNWMDFKVEGKDIWATPKFDMPDKFAAEIAGKYERGIIRSASIGIIPLNMDPDGQDENGRPIWVVTKWILMEISLVDIPSNENAVAFYDENDQPIELSAVIAKFSASTSKPKIEVPMKFQNVPALLGLTVEATDEQVGEKIKSLLALNAKLEKEVGNYKAQAEAARKKEIDDLVTLAVKEGRMPEAEKDQYTKLLGLAFDETKAIIEGLPVRKQIKLSDVPRKKVPVAPSVDADKLTYEGMTFSGMQKKCPDKLGALKAENFEMFNDLYRAEYGKDYRV